MTVLTPPGRESHLPEIQPPPSELDEFDALIKEARRRARRRRAGYASALLVALVLIALGTRLSTTAHTRAPLASRVPVPGGMPADCDTSEMTISRVGIGAGTFHYIQVYAITNTSKSTCRVSGYPRLIAENYPFRSPLRIHEDTMWGGWLRSHGHPAKAVTLTSAASFDVAIGSMGNPDASATRLRYCSKLAPATFKVLLPRTNRPIAGAPIRFGFCPTKYIGSNVYVSPMLANPKPSQRA